MASNYSKKTPKETIGDHETGKGATPKENIGTDKTGVSRHYVQISRKAKKFQYKLQSLLADQADVETLKSTRKEYDEISEDFFTAFSELEQILSDTDELKSLRAAYEEFEVNEANLLFAVNRQICELNDDDSQSVCSRQSFSSSRSYFNITSTKKYSSGEKHSKLVDGDTKESKLERIQSYIDSQEPLKENSNLDPNAPAFTLPSTSQEPAKPIDSSTNPSNTSNNDILLKMMELMVSQHQHEALPKIEPEVFDGDGIDFIIWKKSFETFIETRTENPSERLFYLNKYLRGNAKESVAGLLTLNSNEAYQKAKDTLTNRYGTPFAIAKKYRDKIANWKPISSNDGEGLQKFVDFLQTCETAMENIDYLEVLNDSKENQQMLNLLPNYICNSWSKIVDKWLYEDEKYGKKYPPFKEFVKFLQKEARIACNPITSHKARKGMESTYVKKTDKKRHQRSTLSTNVDTPETKKRDELICKYCQGNHDMDTCDKFLKIKLEERREFVKKKGLCNGCFKHGHRRNNCKEKKTCKTCNRFHPTSFHDEDFIKRIEKKKDESKKNEVVANSLEIGYSSHSLIIPAWLYSQDNVEHKKLCYVIVDDQSDVTFIETKTAKDLNFNGSEIELNLTTMLNSTTIPSQRITGLMLKGYNQDEEIPLSSVYTRDKIPASRSQIPRQETATKYPHLRRMAHQLMPYSEDIGISVLVGRNCLKAMKPKEIISGTDDEPYAVRTKLGWGIISSTPTEESTEHYSNHIITGETTVGNEIRQSFFALKTQVKPVINPCQLNKMLEQDFSETKQDISYSQDDKKFMKILEEGIHRTSNGNYEMPLPFKNPNIQLPNNRKMVLHRTKSLQKKLWNNPRYRMDYETFMNKNLDQGFAEPVPSDELSLNNGTIWYIPHHGIYNEKKPGKIRIVYDCSAQYMGTSLNQQLHTGLDLTSSLLGVLCRFRKEVIAFMCDIEGMFNQVRVNPEHRNFLRFLWWKNGDYDKPPSEYRMTTHLFGATSSPDCANYALKTTANQFQDEFGIEAANFVRQDFYVDDGLKSVPTTEEAIQLIKNTTSLCAKGGFRLHKFVANSQEVIDSIPPSERANETKSLELTKDYTTIERALGVYWCIESDSFQFRIELRDKPLTRRGILSTICSIFDPLGIVAPVLLKGKCILQELCRDGAQWDDIVPDNLKMRWEKWRNSLHTLEKLNIKRCYKPSNFGEIKKIELHSFSDASQTGYGQCSYIRYTNQHGDVHCSLVLAKSRVTPIKSVSIPRLELSAALVSAKVSKLLIKELDYQQDIKPVLWTDSKVTLGYIANDTRKFHIFVANRVQQIRDISDPNQWYYVKTADNPADDASRGLNAEDLVSNNRWWNGPRFLWEKDFSVSQSSIEFPLSTDDPEIKKCAVTSFTSINNKYASLIERLQRFSSWSKMKKVIAICLRYKSILQGSQTSIITTPLSVYEIEQAEKVIIKKLQEEHFEKDLSHLNENKTVSKTSSLHKLDPFLDEKDNLLKVGGRIRRGDFPSEICFPVIIPKRNPVTASIIQHYHDKIHHQGRGMTLNEIRASGLWIINGASEVGYIISRCVQCKKTRSRPQEQKMSNLPEDRLSPSPPFTYSGVDCFGPFYIKEGRKNVKRYSVIFTCMASRAVHLESLNTMDANSFINAYRRFVGRRGPVRQLRSDRGTNFIGAKNELAAAFNEQVYHKLQEDNCDWLPLKTNFPESSHMGGTWERLIRSVRNILNHLLEHHGPQLDDESFRTFLSEAESIINCRPLSVDNLNDPDSLNPLTPNHLLTSKSKLVMPPPGIFQGADMYTRRRWRRVQHISNEFWQRWRKEFLQNLQTRQKWSHPKRNLEKGDIVLVKNEDLPRNHWSLARVADTYQGDDGLVRKVKLIIGTKDLDKTGRRIKDIKYLERPIHKLVLLVPREV